MVKSTIEDSRNASTGVRDYTSGYCSVSPMKGYCSAIFETEPEYSPCLPQVQLSGDLSIIYYLHLFIPGKNICKSQWHF